MPRASVSSLAAPISDGEVATTVTSATGAPPARSTTVPRTLARPSRLASGSGLSTGRGATRRGTTRSPDLPTTSSAPGVRRAMPRRA